MNTITQLKIAYRKIFSKQKNKPDWAVTKENNNSLVSPCIPFVGKHYNETKILLYASAENLIGYGGYLDNDDIAMDRHRIWFNKVSNGQDFPNVHIEPMNNGGLVNVIGYVAMQLCPNYHFNSPRELLEGVSFANFGKFSIEVKEGKNNIDYANDFKKLSMSLEYIKTDLSILNPSILILPKTIYNHKKIKNFLNTFHPEVKIIPIYQIHHFNINRKDRLGKYEKKDKKHLGILSGWHDNFKKGLTGKTSENFYSFYTYLDTILETESPF